MAEQHQGAAAVQAAKVRWASLAVFITVTVAGVVASTGQGFAWPENDYLDHVDQLEAWWSDLLRLGWSRGRVELWEPYWNSSRYFHPHPPLYKWAAMASRHLFPALGFPTAERFPSALLFGVACAALLKEVAARKGLATGVVAAALLACSPRAFGYSGFLTPDMWMLALWCLGGLAWLAFLRHGGTGRAVLAGVLLASALSTKMAALPMPAVWAAMVLLEQRRRGPQRMLASWSVLALLGVAAVGVLLATYPWLWVDPVGGLLGLTVQAAKWGAANPFTALYLGHAGPFTQLPWHWVFVTLVATTPALCCLLAAAGILGARRLHREPLWRTAMLHVVAWMLLTMLPNTPKYDNDRQILPMFPWLAVLGAYGFHWLWTSLPRVQSMLPRSLAAAGACVAMVLTWANALPHPVGFYSALVGGREGAVASGLESTYLMEVLDQPSLERLQEKLPLGAYVAFHPSTDMGRFLQRRGYLRPDLHVGSDGQFHVVVLRASAFMGAEKALRERALLLDSMGDDGVATVELWAVMHP